MISGLIRKLLRNEWELYDLVHDEKLENSLMRLGKELTKNYPYTNYKIIPSEIIIIEYEWKIKEQGHLVFGKLSRRRIREKKEEDYKIIIPVICISEDEQREKNINLPLEDWYRQS